MTNISLRGFDSAFMDHGEKPTMMAKVKREIARVEEEVGAAAAA